MQEPSDNPKDTSWDWGWLYYLATQLLHIPENEFWKMTPKKLCILAEIYFEFNSKSKAETENHDNSMAYIDEIFV